MSAYIGDNRPRLLHRMAWEGFQSHGRDGQPFRDCIHSIPIFVVSNAAAGWASRIANSEETSPLRSMHLAPPYPTFWMEYTIRIAPDASHVVKGLPDGPPCSIGGLFRAHEHSEGWDMTVDLAMTGLQTAGVWFPAMTLEYKVDRDGSLVDQEADVSVSESGVAMVGEPTIKRDANLGMHSLLSCIGLLHCRNIGTQEHAMEQSGERLARRIGSRPTGGFRYRTLTIRGVTNGQRGDGNREQVIMPFHVARGHYKVYKPEAPLFGRLVGRWWWKPVAKGDCKAGVVDKQYVITGTPG